MSTSDVLLDSAEKGQLIVGFAGAITAAALKAENYFERIRVFERRETAGGTWYTQAVQYSSQSILLTCHTGFMIRTRAQLRQLNQGSYQMTSIRTWIFQRVYQCQQLQIDAIDGLPPQYMIR